MKTRLQRVMDFPYPDTPVDGYRIDWWRLSTSPSFAWVYIIKCHAIYFSDSRYEDVFPGERHGAPLKDDWMGYANGSPEGRWCGWDQFPKHMENAFPTWLAAATEAIKRGHEELQYLNTRIEEVNVVLSNLKDGVEKQP